MAPLIPEFMPLYTMQSSTDISFTPFSCKRLPTRDLRATQVADAEKKEQRLKEVFKKQITSFREACYTLFGYRVDMASEATPAAGTGVVPTTFCLTPQVSSPTSHPESSLPQPSTASLLSSHSVFVSPI